MGRLPQTAAPESMNYLQLRLPGWLKNEVLDHCVDLDCSVNAWLVEVVRSALREQRGLPEPPRARAPIPTPFDEMRAYARGEKLLMPCGREHCSVTDDDGSWRHDGMAFCRECSIRVE